MSNEYQGGYTRRQELTCTEAQIATYADIVLHENEKIYVRMNSGVIRMKLGDGVTGLRDLPYTKVFDGDLATVEAWLESKFDKANIAQGLGDSEEKVLSQKAVTREFYSIRGDLSEAYGSYIHEALDWSQGYISPKGTINTTSEGYFKTSVKEIPTNTSKIKLSNYSANNSLSAICFYNSEVGSTATFVGSIVKATNDGIIEVDIPVGATHFACSRNAEDEDFTLLFWVYGVIGEHENKLNELFAKDEILQNEIKNISQSRYVDYELEWLLGFVALDGSLNTTSENYRRTEKIEIPSNVRKIKIGGYSANTSLSTICFYKGDMFVKSYSYDANDMDVEIEVPTDATHFACSRNEGDTDFVLSMYRISSIDIMNEKIEKAENACIDGYENLTFEWLIGFVSVDGGVNTGADDYRRTEKQEIPNNARGVKISGYSANSSLSAICFYNGDNFIKSYVYDTQGEEQEIDIPVNATHFACSRNVADTNFLLSIYCLSDIGVMSEKVNAVKKSNDDVSVYGKKIVIGGDSTTHGEGGTGFAQNGEFVATFGGSTFHRNPNGYCWANLFKALLESKYNATVNINACTGSNSTDWANNIAALVPTDTDLFILPIGTNDRINGSLGTNYEEIRDKVFNNLSTIKKYCDTNNIEFVVCSPVPVSAENENLVYDDGKVAYAVNICQIQEIQKEWCIANGVKFMDTYTQVYNYYFFKGSGEIGSFPDTLHPDDAMYYVIYHIYCSMFKVGASVPKLTPPN